MKNILALGVIVVAAGALLVAGYMNRVSTAQLKQTLDTNSCLSGCSASHQKALASPSCESSGCAGTLEAGCAGSTPSCGGGTCDLGGATDSSDCPWSAQSKTAAGCTGCAGCGGADEPEAQDL